MLMTSDTPNSYYNTEGVSAFRDILALSAVVYARTRRSHGRPSELSHTNSFQFYPWMVDRITDEVVLSNAAQLHIHQLDRFSGQTFPEQPRVSISRYDLDEPLLDELLRRWSIRFSSTTPEWKDRALFRSLNMANDAARVPSSTATVIYDVGRSLALWVSAYEILVHPGGAGISDFHKVSAMFDQLNWRSKKLKTECYLVNRKDRIFAVWLYKLIYDLRNNFLHGNEIKSDDLAIRGRPIIDYAACLYRLLLTAFLRLDTPIEVDTDSQHNWFRSRLGPHRFQLAYEDALLTSGALK